MRAYGTRIPASAIRAKQRTAVAYCVRSLAVERGPMSQMGQMRRFDEVGRMSVVASITTELVRHSDRRIRRKSRRHPARSQEIENFRIRAQFLNQNSLLGRNLAKIFFAPGAKIVFRQYRSRNVRLGPDSGHIADMEGSDNHAYRNLYRHTPIGRKSPAQCKDRLDSVPTRNHPIEAVAIRLTARGHDRASFSGPASRNYQTLTAMKQSQRRRRFFRKP